MKSYHLIVQSRNQKSIRTFLSFFFNSIKNLNFDVIKKYFEKKRKKKILTILKSPHVNKKAQEQFEFRYYSKQITLYSTQNFKHLIFIKKIKDNLFSDVRIKTKFSINKKNENKLREVIFNPDNFQIKILGNKNTRNLKQNKKLKIENYYNTQNKLNRATSKFIKILDTYGEVINKHTLFG